MSTENMNAEFVMALECLHEILSTLNEDELLTCSIAYMEVSRVIIAGIQNRRRLEYLEGANDNLSSDLTQLQEENKRIIDGINKLDSELRDIKTKWLAWYQGKLIEKYTELPNDVLNVLYKVQYALFENSKGK